MLPLLTWVAEVVRGLDSVRPSDVCITPHENIIPPSVQFPCVGIKDGDVHHEDLTGGMTRVIMDVRIIVYVRLPVDASASIVGSGAETGVIALSEQITGLLIQADHPDYEWEDLVGYTGSELFGDGSDFLQRRIATYRYSRIY